jgi:hypothetical protein
MNIVDQTVIVDGREYAAQVYRDQGHCFVRAKDVCAVVRKIVKKKFKQAKCRLSAANSIQIHLPYGTAKEEAGKLRDELRWAAGCTFDGMQDLEESITRKTDCGLRCYFHSRYLFVDIEWREPKEKVA